MKKRLGSFVIGVCGGEVISKLHSKEEIFKYNMWSGGFGARLTLSSTGMSESGEIYEAPGDENAKLSEHQHIGQGKSAFKLGRQERATGRDERMAINMHHEQESVYQKAVDFINRNDLSGFTHIPINSSTLINYYYIFNELFGRQKGCKRTGLSPKSAAILDKILAQWKIVPLEENENPVFCRPYLDEPYGLDYSIWDKNRRQDIQAEAGTYRFKMVGHGTEIHFWTITRWSVINDSDAVFAFLSYTDEGALESLIRLLDKFGKGRRVENRIISVYGGSDIEISSKMCWDDLILPKNIIQSTKEDIEGWIAAEARYKKLHVPYRRGYLFEGPPGNGKTATARTIISEYGFSAHMFNFTDPRLGDNDLQSAFKEAAEDAPAIFLLEDIDRIFDTQQRVTAVTMQGLLNCLDGLATYDGVITIATANNPQVLDPAIRLRPGRFDVPVRFNNPNMDLRRKYLKFALNRTEMSNVSNECIAEVSAGTKGMSMAFVKSIFESAAYISKGDIEDDALYEALSRAKRYYNVMEKGSDRSAGFKPSDAPKEDYTKSVRRSGFSKPEDCSSGGNGKQGISFP